jgi:hypothetical protein
MSAPAADVEVMSFTRFAELYCARQESTPEELLGRLQEQQTRYQPDGWMLLECAVLDSSYMGSLTAVPYGPNNTFQSPPLHPISPRGLASDMSIVIGILLAADLPTQEITNG